MADDTTPVSFTRGAAAKIRDAVKAWERRPTDATGRRRATHQRPDETCWARLTAKVDADSDAGTPDLYSWAEVGLQDDGTWAVLTEGRAGDATADPPDQPAYSPDGTDYAGAVNAAPVLLRRSPVKATDEGADEPYTPGWSIVSHRYPPGTQYQVLQRPDDAGTPPIFDYVRATNA